MNGFVSFTNFDVEFNENINVIVGNNGVGKSNFAELATNTINLDENKINIRDYINDNNDNKYVEIHFKLNQDEIILFNKLYILGIICRYINNNTNQLVPFEHLYEYFVNVKQFDNDIKLVYKPTEKTMCTIINTSHKCTNKFQNICFEDIDFSSHADDRNDLKCIYKVLSSELKKNNKKQYNKNDYYGEVTNKLKDINFFNGEIAIEKIVNEYIDWIQENKKNNSYDNFDKDIFYQ